MIEKKTPENVQFVKFMDTASHQYFLPNLFNLIQTAFFSLYVLGAVLWCVFGESFVFGQLSTFFMRAIHYHIWSIRAWRNEQISFFIYQTLYVYKYNAISAMAFNLVFRCCCCCCIAALLTIIIYISFHFIIVLCVFFCSLFLIRRQKATL